MTTSTAPAQRALLQAYLPATLIRSWAENPAQPPIWGCWITGSLMHCDVTGFTAMSEGLASVGNEGAEIMAGVLNRFFERMLDIGDRWGGENLKFGGDAILLYFGGEAHARRAAACGLEMQAAMPEFRAVKAGEDSYALRMRIGVHSGRFYTASVGRSESLLHYMLLGNDVSRTVALEAEARPGEVMVSRETAELLGPGASTSRREGGLRVRSVSVSRPQLSAAAHAADERSLRPYVLPALAERASGNADTWPGEHRHATVMFINLTGASDLLERREERALAALDSFVRAVLSAAERHGGSLVGSDVSEQGEKLIVLFGAPVAQERREREALQAALALREQVAALELPISHRIGINSGNVFAGEIGSKRRREYTVIGDAVNLSARLMSAAGQREVLVSKQTLERAGAGFEFRRMRPVRVKGKARPVRVCRLLGPGHGSGAGQAAASTPMVGRQQQLARLEELARRAEKGTPRWALVTGEPGMGKTRLLWEVVARLGARGWVVAWGESHAHTAGVPYSAWKGPLRTLLGIEGEEVSWEDVGGALSRLAPMQTAFVALIADVLGVPVPENERVPSLGVELRARKLREAVWDVVLGRTKEAPVLLVFEDVHWMDGPSRELVGAITALGKGAVLACMTSRGEVPGWPAGRPPDLELRLAALPDDAALQLIRESGVDERSADAILERAQGNPLFLQEFARNVAAGRTELPETISDLIMARLDRLMGEDRRLLQLASVIGPTFELDVLGELGRASAWSRPWLRSRLKVLRTEGFVRDGSAEAPSFAHAIIRDVAYESLPFAERRRLHRSISEYLERAGGERPASMPELLLHHSVAAGDTRRVIRYAAMSGDRAAAVFANEVALAYYHQALDAVNSMSRRAGAAQGLLLERIGDCLETAGKHGEAAETYVQALEVGGRARRTALLPHIRPDRARYSAVCRKTGASLERACAYPEALEWLDRALEGLQGRRLSLAAEICANKSVCYMRRGTFEDAAEWGRRAVQLALRSGEGHRIAYARNMLANAYINKGDLRKAIRQLRGAVRLYHELRDLPGQASSNNNLGACYHLQGTLDAALHHYNVALQTDERVGDVVDATVVRGNIGEVLLMLGRTEEARRALEDVASAPETRELPGLRGFALINLSRCEQRLGRLNEARSAVLRATRLLARIGDRGMLTEARVQQAEVLLACGKEERALAVARQALAAARREAAHLLEARALRTVGEALDACGRASRAEERLISSMLLARKVRAEYEEGRSALALGRHLLAMGARRARVRPYLRRSAMIFGRMGARFDYEMAERLLEKASPR